MLVSKLVGVVNVFFDFCENFKKNIDSVFEILKKNVNFFPYKIDEIRPNCMVIDTILMDCWPKNNHTSMVYSN